MQPTTAIANTHASATWKVVKAGFQQIYVKGGKVHLSGWLRIMIDLCCLDLASFYRGFPLGCATAGLIWLTTVRKRVCRSVCNAAAIGAKNRIARKTRMKDRVSIYPILQ